MGLELYLRRELTAYKYATFIVWPLAIEELILKTTVRILFGYTIVNVVLLAFKGKPLISKWTRIVKIAVIVFTVAAYIGLSLAVWVFFGATYEFGWPYARAFYYMNLYHPWVYIVLGAALAGFSLKKPENASDADASCKAQ